MQNNVVRDDVTQDDMAEDEILRRALLDAEPSGPLLPWRRYRFPIDWAAQFGGEGPLRLEIGFGDGRYTVRRAKDERKGRFVGLEISSASLQRALHKVRREGLDNVRLLKIGANFAVRHLFAPRSLQTVTVNFPDPWPKARHEENRLLRAPFFELSASRLRPGGKILLATDHPDYLAFAQTEADKTGLYALYEAEPPAAVFETKYALKWKAQGKPLHYQVFEYRGGDTPLYPPLERVETMPHALLNGTLPASFDGFEKRVVPYASGHVILHEVLRGVGSDEGERLLVRATVDEPDLKQGLLVVVGRREGDELIVRLEPFGDPVITRTARGAVHAVTEWLLTLGAGIRVKTRAY